MPFSLTQSSKSVSADTLANFVGSAIEDDIRTVPGVGTKAEELLAAANIHTTHALIGIFLTLRTKGMSVQDHCNAFYEFLVEAKINTHRSSIVRAVAEKVNVFIPGTFDEKAFSE